MMLHFGKPDWLALRLNKKRLAVNSLKLMDSAIMHTLKGSSMRAIRSRSRAFE
jgi:hypothetical protein